jgi:hypothetical protein
MEKINKELQEFIDTSGNAKTYRIVRRLSGDLSYLKEGEKIASSALYDNGYNILDLLKYGMIKSADEPFDWQRDLVGKNEHSVYSRCPQCQSFGVNMPLDNVCGNCGYQKCITYYDAQTIDQHIIHKHTHP